MEVKIKSIKVFHSFVISLFFYFLFYVFSSSSAFSSLLNFNCSIYAHAEAVSKDTNDDIRNIQNIEQKVEGTPIDKNNNDNQVHVESSKFSANVHEEKAPSTPLSSFFKNHKNVNVAKVGVVHKENIARPANKKKHTKNALTELFAAIFEAPFLPLYTTPTDPKITSDTDLNVGQFEQGDYPLPPVSDTTVDSNSNKLRNRRNFSVII